MTYSQNQTREGFTLIEIMVAVMIVGLFLGFGIPAALRYFRRARRTKTESILNLVKGAVEQYNLELGQYPKTLRDLEKKPTDPKLAKKWSEPILEEVPEDAWNNRLEYKLTPGGQRRYELWSFGPEGPGSPQGDWISAWD